jgi:hypothetical protein
MENVWLGSALRLHQILEDRSFLFVNVSSLALEIDFELGSRLSHQPIIQDFFSPPLINM